MPLHFIAFDASDAANVALTQLNAVASEFDGVQNNGVVIGFGPAVPAPLSMIIGATAYSPHLQRAQFRAPSLMAPDYPLITPIALARPTSAIHQVWTDWRNGAPVVKVGEALLAYEQHITSTEHVYIGALLADKIPMPSVAPFRTVQLTGTTTLVADVWNNCLMTFTDQLPFGNYDVVGARVEGASPVFFRLAVPGVGYRPGGPCLLDAVSDDVGVERLFRFGNMGVWFSFNSMQQMTLEVLPTTTDTAQTLYLDIVGPK
jgi:hypothetical protein